MIEDFPTEVSPTRTTLYMKSVISNNQQIINKFFNQTQSFNNIYIQYTCAISYIINLSSTKRKSKNMDQPQPGPSNISRPMGFPMPIGQSPMPIPMGGMPPMGQPIVQGFNQSMVPAAMRQFAAPPFFNPIQSSLKANEFNKGVYVSGFERSLTAIMLQQHFKIKQIAGLRLPLTKHGENKGFAFIYYHSSDDASFVKQKLDHSVILQSKIRVTKTVVADNLSKMMFKIKKNIPQNELKEAREYFNEKNLESAVTNVIKPIFDKHVQVNKIIIPHSKKNINELLSYARGFFYISNITQAKRTTQITSVTSTSAKKQEYESVLRFIAERLNNDPTFSKYVKAQIYEYANKNKQNVIHIKNINMNVDEDPAKVAEELKNFIQQHRRQDEILGCFVKQFQKGAGWANISFKTYEEAVNTYEHFKNNRIYFRGNLVYANLRNVKDLRTVVISVVKGDVKQERMRQFLKKLSEESPRVDSNDETKGRKYEWASFKIIQSKVFYLDNNHHSVGLTEDQKPEQSWRQINSVPRRVVIHFMNQFNDKDLRQLVLQIKLKPKWDQIFIEKDRKTVTKATHQKGHIQNDYYVKHNDLNRKRNDSLSQLNRIPKGQPGKKQQNDQQFSYKPNTRINPQKNFRGNGQVRQQNLAGNRPGPLQQINTKTPFSSIPIPMPMNKMPTMGGMQAPMGGMGGIGGSMPPIGGMQPTMGGMQSPMGGMQPPMGGMQPPMGGMQPPMGGMQPQMGGMQPPMGGMPPTMGGMPLSFMSGPKQGMQPPIMGQGQPNLPPQEKKQ